MTFVCNCLNLTSIIIIFQLCYYFEDCIILLLQLVPWNDSKCGFKVFYNVGIAVIRIQQRLLLQTQPRKNLAWWDICIKDCMVVAQTLVGYSNRVGLSLDNSKDIVLVFPCRNTSPSITLYNTTLLKMHIKVSNWTLKIILKHLSTSDLLPLETNDTILAWFMLYFWLTYSN